MNEQTTEPLDERDDAAITLFDLLQVIAQNLRLLIVGPFVIGLIALGVSFLITPTFTATTTILPPLPQQSSAAALMQALGALGGAVGSTGGLKSQADQYVALIGSRSVKDALIERFDLVKRYGVTLKQDARKMLEDVTRFSAGRDGLIRIEVEDHDPKFAADAANAYVEELSRLMGRLALTEAQQRRGFYEAQLSKAKDALVKAEEALKATGISESTVKASPQSAVSAVAGMMAEVTALEIKLSGMRSYMTDNAPDVKRTQAELGALRTQLARAEKDIGVSQGGGDYIARYRDFKYNETLYELIAKQYEIARIDESRDGSILQVVDKAIPPERKTRPKKALFAITATFIAFGLLVLFLVLRLVMQKILMDSGNARKLDELRASMRRALLRNRA